MDLQPIIDRLQQEVPAFGGVVGGARELLYALSNPPDISGRPEAFVIIGRETSGENQFSTNVVQQKVTTHFLVILRINNITEAAQEGSHEELSALLDKIRLGLIGWSPDDGIYDPLIHLHGGLESLLDGVLWWQEAFQSGYLLRSIQNG